jgi:para-nitrobenzyl esterase
MSSIVETTSGRVEGRVEDGVRVFRGIPYAEPPVGPLRFRPPLPKAPWAGVRPALEFGAWAPQEISPGARRYWGITGETSEDCLTLNVWAPASDRAGAAATSTTGRGRPVMVWIHGGAFVAGASSYRTSEGASLARRGDLVVVTLNYRVGALGFLELDEIGGEEYALSGNLGLLDQMLALEWVRDNVAAFGGDPGNVTIFGESAGAISVSVLLALPSAIHGASAMRAEGVVHTTPGVKSAFRGAGDVRSEGLVRNTPGAHTGRLFRRAIAQSGAASIVRRLDRARERARELLALANVDGIEGLRRLSADDLVRLQSRLAPRGAEQVFGPVMDDRVVPTSPMASIAAGESNDIPLLTGSNLDEYRYWLMVDPRLPGLRPHHLHRRLREVTGGADPEPIIDAYRRSRPHLDDNQIAITLLGDIAFRLPMLRMAEARVRGGADTWVYLFARPSPVEGGRLGAAHAMEIPFVFGTIDAPQVHQLIGDGAERGPLSRAMQDAWIAFARTGDPSHPGLPAWPRWDAERQATMIFDVPCRVEEDPLREERLAWGGATFQVHA